MPTYDQKQMAAVLTCCQKCGKSWYATHPTAAWVCRACRRAEAKERRILEALDRFARDVEGTPK